MNVSYAPSWFFGYDIGLQLIFGLTSLIVALMAYKVYRCSSQQPLSRLSLSFFLISLSYLFQASVNGFIVFNMKATPIRELLLLYSLGQYIGVILLISGLITLFYMILKEKKPMVFWVLFLIVIIALETSANLFLTTFALEVLFLAFLTWHFVNNYLKKKTRAALFVALGFSLLLLGSLSFVMSVDYKVFYVVAHILTFLGYTAIAANLVLVLRNAKKKK